MARPPEFDRTKALEAAMKLFWIRGFTATSLPDLLEAMGIARSSFYASFRTKRDLFTEWLSALLNVPIASPGLWGMP